MDGRPTWTDCNEAGDYVVPYALSPRDLVFRPDNMGETVPHTQDYGRNFRHSSANHSILCSTICSKFELLLDIMHVLFIYKFKMDWINTKREKN